MALMAAGRLGVACGRLYHDAMGSGPRGVLWAKAGVLAAAVVAGPACTNDFDSLTPEGGGGSSGGRVEASGSGGVGTTAVTGGGGGSSNNVGAAAGAGGCGAGTAECDGENAGCESLESVHHCGACDNDCSVDYPAGWHCIASVGCGCQDDADCSAGTTADAKCDQASGVCTCETKACNQGEACGVGEGEQIVCICGKVECLGGFVCDTDQCACTSDGSCGFGGTCTRGRCVCDSQTCAANRKCEMDGGCEEQ